MTSPLHTEFDSIAALGEALAARRLSAVELAQSALDALPARQGLNAFLHVDADLTLAQARLADEQIAAGKAGPLAGVPIAHKDLLVTRGWRTTAASRMLADYTSPFDATAVQRWADAGAVSLGKLNCDEFGMGSSNETSAFGPVHNPWDDGVIPGGSSGGSAAAVAAGLVMGASATDTGGSIRQPAAFCGVSGIRPTYGVVSRFGIVACASSMDTAGPMARSARDLVTLLDAMSGFDAADATSLEHCGDQANAPGRIRSAFDAAGRRQAGYGSTPLKGLRIGVPDDDFGPHLAPDVKDVLEQALRQLESLGAERVPIRMPHAALAVPVYYVISPAEASSNLSRFDGVRYGHRAAEYSDLNDMISRSRNEAFGDEIKRRIMLGSYVLSHGYYDAYYLQAQRLRRLIAEDFRQALAQDCDVIVGPVSPDVARALNSCRDTTQDWKNDAHTVGASLAGLPALSVPCGFAAGSGLPVGLQMVGRYFAEGDLLAVADRYQSVTDWHQRKPEAA